MMTSTCSADGSALPRGKRTARKLKTVTFSLDDLLAGLVSRQRLEDEIERLIGILDAADPDPDLEETGDLEPSLGTCSRGVVDSELDTCDDEPSLGSLDRAIDQRRCNGPDRVNMALDLEQQTYASEPRRLGLQPWEMRHRERAEADHVGQQLTALVSRLRGRSSMSRAAR